MCQQALTTHKQALMATTGLSQIRNLGFTCLICDLSLANSPLPFYLISGVHLVAFTSYALTSWFVIKELMAIHCHPNQCRESEAKLYSGQLPVLVILGLLGMVILLKTRMAEIQRRTVFLSKKHGEDWDMANSEQQPPQMSGCDSSKDNSMMATPIQVTPASSSVVKEAANKRGDPLQCHAQPEEDGASDTQQKLSVEEQNTDGSAMSILVEMVSIAAVALGLLVVIQITEHL
jgi:hypothetical protein